MVPFIVHADDYSHKYDVFRISPESLPLDGDCAHLHGTTITGNLEHISNISAVHVSDHSELRFLEREVISWSPSGLQVFLDDRNQHPIDDGAPHTHIYLQPIEDKDLRTNDIRDMHLEGFIGCHARSTSGNHAALIINGWTVCSRFGGGPASGLHLLRFSNIGITTRQLRLPDDVNESSCTSRMAMDERRGVLYLLSNHEELLALRFV
ncbi:hypothetical protein FPV67DRAFT_741077 [Lyophyllum atratum]|nr:hypothetical protein FPV67DRAFT_741077 [Lyophyllum atratum]